MTNKHQQCDQLKWIPWAFVAESDVVFSREYVVAFCDHKVVLGSSNTTVILERMTRRGRADWERKYNSGA